MDICKRAKCHVLITQKHPLAKSLVLNCKCNIKYLSCSDILLHNLLWSENFERDQIKISWVQNTLKVQYQIYFLLAFILCQIIFFYVRILTNEKFLSLGDAFFFVVGFSLVLVGQKIESQTITKYAIKPLETKTNHFMLLSQELSLILPLVPNWVNSRFGPILNKVDKILITILIGNYTQLLTRLLLSKQC